MYQTAPSPVSRLVWFDREGRELGAVGDTADYGDLLLSPDGQRVSVSIDVPGGGNRDIWVFDAVRGVGSRATFDSGNELEGVWSPDGSLLVYNSNRAGRLNLYEKQPVEQVRMPWCSKARSTSTCRVGRRTGSSSSSSRRRGQIPASTCGPLRSRASARRVPFCRRHSTRAGPRGSHLMADGFPTSRTSRDDWRYT